MTTPRLPDDDLLGAMVMAGLMIAVVILFVAFVLVVF